MVAAVTIPTTTSRKFSRCPRKFHAKFQELPTVGKTYRAKKLPNGNYAVFGLPIFSETKRFNRGSKKIDIFDEAWLTQAVAAAKRRQDDPNGSYLPPAHVNHTDAKGKTTQQFAGYIANQTVKKHRLEGADKATIFADVIEMPPAIYREFEKMRLGYRSVEINNPAKREISSVALLPAEVPYFKYAVSGVKLDDPDSPDTSARMCEALSGPGVTVVYPFKIRFQEQDMPYDQNDEALASGTKTDDKDKQKMEAAPPEATPPAETPPAAAAAAPPPAAAAPPPAAAAPPPAAAGVTPDAAIAEIQRILASIQMPAPAQPPAPIPAPVTASELQMNTTPIPPEVMARFAEIETSIAKQAATLDATARKAAIAAGYAMLASHRETAESGGDGVTLQVGMPAAEQYLETKFGEGNSSVLDHLPTADIPAFFRAYLPGAQKVRFVEDHEPKSTSVQGDDGAVDRFVEQYEALDDEAQAAFTEYREHFDANDESDQNFVMAAAARFAAFDASQKELFGPNCFAYTMRQYEAAHQMTIDVR